MLANHSNVLHFHGKSTWDGNESTYEEEQRRSKYIAKSMKKWGINFTEIFIKGNDAKEWCEKLGLNKEFENGDAYSIINILHNKLKEDLPKEQITSNN